MNDYNDYPCEHRSTKFVCFNIFFTIIAVAAMGLLCILFCTHRAGLTLELDNKRAAAISNNETVLWNKTITSVNSDITYDETTGQITFHRSGYYYINYYFNVIPNTVNTDFGFALSDASSQKLMANGGGSSSGSPTSYASTQAVLKITAGDTFSGVYHSLNSAPILLSDTVVQANFTAFCYSN